MHANTNNRIPKVIQRNTEKGYENSERRRTCFHAEPSNCTQSSLEETPLSLPALGSIPAGWGAKQRLTTNSKASRWFCQLSSGSLPISYSPHPGGLFSSPRLCGHFDTTGHLLRQAGLPSVSPGASPAPFSVFRVLRPPVITPAGRGPLGLRRLSGKRNLQDYTKRCLVYRITYCIGSNKGDRILQYNKYNKTRGTE